MGSEASGYIDRVIAAMQAAYVGWPIEKRPESPASANRPWAVQVGVNGATGASNGALGFNAVLTCEAMVVYEGRASTHNSSFQFMDIALTVAAWLAGWVDETGNTIASNIRMQPMGEMVSTNVAGVDVPTGRYAFQILWDVSLFAVNPHLDIPGYDVQSPFPFINIDIGHPEYVLGGDYTLIPGSLSSAVSPGQVAYERGSPSRYRIVAADNEFRDDAALLRSLAKANTTIAVGPLANPPVPPPKDECHYLTLTADASEDPQKTFVLVGNPPATLPSADLSPGRISVSLSIVADVAEVEVDEIWH